MENYCIKNEIRLICIKADTFPEGVAKAHQKIRTLTGDAKERRYYGISFPESTGKIKYMAAAGEEYPGEAAALGCNEFTIPAGEYAAVYIKDFMKNIPAIAKAFSQLLGHPLLNTHGCCVEIYVGDNDVRCMVPLRNQ